MSKFVIFDIDGVLADCEHRLHYILPPPGGEEGFEKDWENFDRFLPYDTVIKASRQILRMFAIHGYTIILMTGRGERTRVATETWLEYHRIQYTKLYMRSSTDFRHAAAVKMGMLNKLGADYDDIECVFEDEPQTIAQFRMLGLTVFNPADWDAKTYAQSSEGGTTNGEVDT